MPARPGGAARARARVRARRDRRRRLGSVGDASSARCATSTSGCSTARCSRRSRRCPRRSARSRRRRRRTASRRSASRPRGALRHIAALTSGLSRKATIQRHLMPVMLRWFADGADPDYGLLAFRRISERLGDTPWFLRMLRDSSGAAERLTRVLSGSRYVGELMEWIPESAAWLDDDELLRPRSGLALAGGGARDPDAPRRRSTTRCAPCGRLRRRELLRIAMARDPRRRSRSRRSRPR